MLAETTLPGCSREWVAAFAGHPPVTAPSGLRFIGLCQRDRAINCSVLEDVRALVLDPRDLAVTDAELLQLIPQARTDPQLHRRLVNDTRGVPALVAAALPNPEEPTGRLQQVARQWAERVLPIVVGNPLVAMHARLGSLGERSMTQLARALVEEPPTLDDIRRSRESNLICQIDDYRAAMPDALARELCALMEERDPDWTARMDQRLVDEATNNPRISRLTAMRVFIQLRSWRALDALLAEHMHLALHLSGEERDIIVARWPYQVPRQLPRLARVRQFIGDRDGGHEDLGSLLSETMRYFALLAEPGAAPGSLADEARQRIVPELDYQFSEKAAFGKQTLHDHAAWLEAKVTEFASDRKQVGPEDLALLSGLAGLLAMAAASIGDLATALDLAGLQLRVANMLPPDSALWASTHGWTHALNAFVTAMAGMPSLTRSHIIEYERVVGSNGWQEFPMQRVIGLARNWAALMRGDPDELAIDSGLEAQAAQIPQFAQAEALRILLTRGPQAAVEWIQTVLSRVSWVGAPAWIWWPAHYVLILLQAQTGRVNAAQTWLAKADLPPVLAAAVRASIDVALGRKEAAIKTADGVLDQLGVPHSWRLIAAGAKLAALADDQTGQRDAMLAAEDWSSALASVALFPDAARALVAGQLPTGLVAQLPGLQQPDAENEPVQLTQRQVEVLAELASDATMAQIGRRLFISTETVRSTAKQLYRRVGVHDRDAAVELGRELGII